MDDIAELIFTNNALIISKRDTFSLSTGVKVYYNMYAHFLTTFKLQKEEHFKQRRPPPPMQVERNLSNEAKKNYKQERVGCINMRMCTRAALCASPLLMYARTQRKSSTQTLYTLYLKKDSVYTLESIFHIIMLIISTQTTLQLVISPFSSNILSFLCVR